MTIVRPSGTIPGWQIETCDQCRLWQRTSPATPENPAAFFLPRSSDRKEGYSGKCRAGLTPLLQKSVERA
jgi:hypothetical protein